MAVRIVPRWISVEYLYAHTCGGLRRVEINELHVPVSLKFGFHNRSVREFNRGPAYHIQLVEAIGTTYGIYFIVPGMIPTAFTFTGLE